MEHGHIVKYYFRRFLQHRIIFSLEFKLFHLFQLVTLLFSLPILGADCIYSVFILPVSAVYILLLRLCIIIYMVLQHMH
ncbi:hypothetical protein C8R42DRAFT_405809 [Lentinula raphanica]|nr:hypothetical protein C8R42DRAFT_405809 [Lentinula raphanica]